MDVAAKGNKWTYTALGGGQWQSAAAVRCLALPGLTLLLFGELRPRAWAWAWAWALCGRGSGAGVGVGVVLLSFLSSEDREVSVSVYGVCHRHRHRHPNDPSGFTPPLPTDG